MTPEIVRQYEPVLHFARGENFFPMAVVPYVKQCSLHTLDGERGVLEIPPGFVETGDLSHFIGREHYLVYADRQVDDPGELQQVNEWVKRQQTVQGVEFDQFKRQLKDNLIKLGVDVAQLIKPFHLPREVFERALQSYGGLATTPPAYHYRLMDAGDYRLIQYWYFYAYNDFATSHGGMNDHEGDWESVHLFLKDDEPVWVTCSSHIGHGRELGRAFDPRQMELDGFHPVVYVAAGSHANYHTPGEYPPDKAFVHGEVVLGGSTGLPWAEPHSLDQPCFEMYRGRWGARQWDSLTHRLGESRGGAPTGPRFNRDGSIRDQWARPLTFAGLDESH